MAESLTGHPIDGKTITTSLRALVSMYMVRLVREYGI